MTDEIFAMNVKALEMKGSAMQVNYILLDHLSHACVRWFTESSVQYILMILVDSHSCQIGCGP